MRKYWKKLFSPWNLEFLKSSLQYKFDLLLFHDFWISWFKDCHLWFRRRSKISTSSFKGAYSILSNNIKRHLMLKPTSNFAWIFHDKRLWIVPSYQILHFHWNSHEANLVRFLLLTPVDSLHLLKTRVWVPQPVRAVDVGDALCCL